MAAVAAHFLCPPVPASTFTSVSLRSRGRALTIGSTTLCSDIRDGMANFSIMESIVVDSFDFDPERCADVPCDPSKSAMVAASCCTNFLGVRDATDRSDDDDESRYLFRSRSQTNVAAHHTTTTTRTTRSHSTLSTGHLSLSLPGSSSPDFSPSSSPCVTPKAFGDDMGHLVIDFASCLDFQITTEHVQIPTVDIYALVKKHSSKYGSSSRTNRQELFRADSGPSGNPMCAPKPRSVSIFENLLSQTPNDEEDVDMHDDDSSDDRGVLARAQSDSVAMAASSSCSFPSLLQKTKRMKKGARGGKMKNVNDGENPRRRRRALDFSEAFAASTKAPSPPVVPITDTSSFGGRQRSPSVSRPSTLTRKRSRDFLGRDHDHPANMPLQRGRKNPRSRLAGDCSNSPCLFPEQPPTSLSKIAPTETPEADFPLPSTPSLSSQSFASLLSRSPSSPSLSLSLSSDSFTLCHNERSSSTTGRSPASASKDSRSSDTSPSSLELSQKPYSESDSPTLSENALLDTNKQHVSSFTAFLDDCDTTDRERRSGGASSVSVSSSKENRDPCQAANSLNAAFSMENSSGTKGNGTRRTLAMGAFDDDSDEEMMEISKPQPIKLPQTLETLLPLRMAPLNPNLLSPPKSAPALISSLARDPHMLTQSGGFTFGQARKETHTSSANRMSSHEKLKGATADTNRVAHTTRARSNTHTRQVHTCTVDELPRNLSLSEMSQTWPNVRKHTPALGSTVGTKSPTDQTQPRKNSVSRPVPVMPAPKFVSLDVVNENIAMDDGGDCQTETTSESASSPSRSCKTILPIVRKNCMIPEISGGTLRDLFAGAYRDGFDHFAVVDCRYVYEYRGGHIKGALNLWRKNDLTAFYHANRDLASNKRMALIFHCEYSKNRAPRAAAHFRKLDRDHNDYPQLSFPHLFVLNGGYRQLYRSLQADSNGSMDVYCDPPAYVSMWDEKFIRENKMCKDLEKPRRGARSRTASTPDVW